MTGSITRTGWSVRSCCEIILVVLSVARSGKKNLFFFNYEGFREAKGSTVVREVPLSSLGQGIVRYFSANGANDPSCPEGTPKA